MIANLFWAGNVVLSRGIAGVVPPITLAYWRWTGAFLVAVGFAWPYLKQDAPVLLRHWRMMLLLSATGIASYNTMSYIGLTSTTALNATDHHRLGIRAVRRSANAVAVSRRAAFADRCRDHRGKRIA